MPGLTAVVLAGGQGTRLRPLTLDVPKPMLPVLNKPFLEHLVLRLRHHGVQRVILALGYQSDAITRYFGDGSSLGIQMTYRVESAPLGTAGAVKFAAGQMSDPFLVLNGDVLMDLDISALLRRHQETGASATLALHAVDDPSRFGVVPTDEQGRILRFVEKPPGPDFPSHFINSGCYVLEPHVLDWIPEGQPYMFEHHLFPALLSADELLHGFHWEGYWRDMGTPESYLALHYELLDGQPASIGTDCAIHPTAQITGPVLIGRGCIVEAEARVTGPTVLGAGCRIGPGTRIERSVLWDNVIVEEGATLQDSIAGSRVVIGAHVTVQEQSILASGIHVAPHTRLAPGTLLFPADDVSST